MATDTNIQGLACDFASCEIGVGGNPVPEAFTSISPEWGLEPEKIWVNGKASPHDRTEGKFDASMGAEMPWKQWCGLKERLGGQGDDPSVPQYLITEFACGISYRPKNDDKTYLLELQRCRIKKVSMDAGQGKATMAKLDVDVMGVSDPAPQ